MKPLTKQTLSFVIAAFAVSTILQIVYDIIIGVTLAEMMTIKYILIELVSAFIFAVVFVAVFKLLHLLPDNKTATH